MPPTGDKPTSNEQNMGSGSKRVEVLRKFSQLLMIGDQICAFQERAAVGFDETHLVTTSILEPNSMAAFPSHPECRPLYVKCCLYSRLTFFREDNQLAAHTPGS